ncbi:MAG TPA: LysM peptidoglycan-binding domain-containing protein [Thermoanaerobaculia bacterium]|jgi:hypothetical protein|nr:LysM peptidoglycan-binding domain-containing protein [Thermoanaerobaculia bacterium]
MDSTYTIAPGDTFSAISAKTGVGMNDLLAANPHITDPNKIYAGQSLTIPGAKTTSPTGTTPAATPMTPPTMSTAPTTQPAGTGSTSTNSPPSAVPDASQNDLLAQQLGYKDYTDAITQLTAPPPSATDFYNTAYASAGLPDILNQIASKKDALNSALGVVNDNPWYDEAFRKGEAGRLQTLADADINNLQTNYNTRLASVHDLVTQHTSDSSMTDAANKARLSYLETQAKANADALAAGPKTVTGGNGEVYAWNPTTQTFDSVIGPKTTYQVVKGNNVTDAFGNTTTTPDRIFDPTTGKFVTGGGGVSSSAGGGGGLTGGNRAPSSAAGGTPSVGTGPNKLDFNQYGLLANTDLNPKSSLDMLAQKYLDTYLKDGTVPTYTSLGRGISPSGFAQVTTRAASLYYQATGNPLPTPQVIKGYQQNIVKNNTLGNNLQYQVDTVKGNVDLSLSNMTRNGLNSSGFKPLDDLINNVRAAFQDPNVGQLLAQNTTIQNELGSLLAVKNAGGTTVFDKLSSAGIISSGDSPAVIQQKVQALIQEASIFSDSLANANASQYSQTDPLLQDANNPARATYAQQQSNQASGLAPEFSAIQSYYRGGKFQIPNHPDISTREQLIASLQKTYPRMALADIQKAVYSQFPDQK